MKKMFAAAAMAVLLFNASHPAFAASTAAGLSSSTAGSLYAAAYPVSYNPPYSSEDFPEEYIEPVSGSVTLTENILSLPGKNGFDFNLALTYNNQNYGATYCYDSTSYTEEFMCEAYYYDYTNENGSPRMALVMFNDEAQMLEEAPESFPCSKIPDLKLDSDDCEYFTYSKLYDENGTIIFTRCKERRSVTLRFANKTNLYKGKGYDDSWEISDIWRWKLPVIQDFHEPVLIDTRDKYKDYEDVNILVDLDLNTCPIEYEYTIKKSDKSLVSTGMTVDASEGKYTCEYGGTEDITDEERGITYRCSVTDSKGRTVYFRQNGYPVMAEDRFGNRITYEVSQQRLDKVTDSLGRVISFVYGDDSVEIYVDADGSGDGEAFLAAKLLTSCENDDYLDPNEHLLADNEYHCRLVRYEDAETEYVKDFKYRSIEGQFSSGTFNIKKAVHRTGFNISDISHPNGIVTHYDYLKKTSKLDNVGKNIYRISSRKDIDGEKEYGHYTYSYGTESGSITPMTTETRILDGEKVTYTGSGYLTKKECISGDLTYRESYGYRTQSGRLLPTRSSQSYIQGKTSSETRNITSSYDSYNRRIKEQHDDCTNSVTYFGDSQFVKSSVINRDSDQTALVKTEYTLSLEGSDFYAGRTVDRMTVSESEDGGENYTVKYYVDYTYNSDGTLASETADPNGINRRTEYSYLYTPDGGTQVTATQKNVSNADGGSDGDLISSVKSDYRGRVVSGTTATGDETKYEYDNVDRLTKVINPDGTSVVYEYDTAGREVIRTDENGVMEKTLFDGFGNAVAVYKNNGTSAAPQWLMSFEYEYDSILRLVKLTQYRDYSGSTATKKLITQYSYGSFDCLAEKTVSDETGAILLHETYSYDMLAKMSAAPTSVHDAANGGNLRQFTKVTVTTDADDTITPPVTESYYDRRDRLCKQIRTDGSDSYYTTYTYDALGNVLEEKDERAYADLAVDYTAKYEYNYLSKVTKAYNAAGNCTTYAYDALGSLVSQTDCEGNTVNYTNDNFGRKIKESAPVDDGVNSLIKYYYDPNGNLEAVCTSGAAGDAWRMCGYDECGRLEWSYDGQTYTKNAYLGSRLVKSVTGLARYTYSIADLTASNATYTVTEYEYDKFGNAVKDTDYNGEKTYAYDFSGNVIQSVDPNGTTITNTYDSSGRLLKSTAGSDEIIYTYNAFGLCTSAKRNGEETLYSYDNFGRAVTETKDGKTLSREYNIDGQTTLFTLTEGGEVLQSASYTYDALGNMASASNGEDTISYTYNLNGLPILEDRGYLVTEHSYTAGNLPKNTKNYRHAVQNPNSPRYDTLIDVSEFNYTYCADGNVATVSDSRCDSSADYVTSYSYDTANRLTGAEITSDGESVRAWSYTYNKTGDMTAKAETVGGVTTTTTYTYTNHRLTREDSGGEATTYTYDANGNLTAKLNDTLTVNYTYTPRNEVKTVTFGGAKSGTYTYTYDANSLRTAKSDGTTATKYTWSGSNIVREETGAKKTDYFYGANRVSRSVTGPGYSCNIYDDEGEIERVVKGYHEFYLCDGRGNVVQTADPDAEDHLNAAFKKTSGEYPEFEVCNPGEINIADWQTILTDFPVMRSYYYSPYGELWQGENDYDTNPFGYAGEFRDKETGDIYLRARYYNPATGRFISVDPIKDGANWYVYCGNNPIAFVDPSGLFDENDVLYVGGDNNTNDVKVLQHALSKLGLYQGKINGQFEESTKAAVIEYQNSKGLGIDGNVDINTWESLGLIYRTDADIKAGVEIVTVGSKQYFDISKPVTAAVEGAKADFESHKLDVSWFIGQVKNQGVWNVKRNEQVWSSTLGISVNSYNTTLIFYGRVVEIDDIGNITYGYLGKAAGFPDIILKCGSMGYHIYNHGAANIDNELRDESYIKLGVDWYKGRDIQVRLSAQ